MLELSADDLAEISSVGRSTILRYENRRGGAYAETLQALRVALEDRGVEFLGNNGVRWDVPASETGRWEDRGPRGRVR